MSDTDLTWLAVHGEGGIDLFERIEDAGHKRTLFRCVAMLVDDRLVDFEPHLHRDPAPLRAAARRLAEVAALARPFAMGDWRQYPRAEGGAAWVLLLYHEFFRAWQVADLGAARLIDEVTNTPENAPASPAALVGAVAPLHEFNRLSLGADLARRILPPLTRHCAAPGFADDGAGNIGFALRMLGDLALRGTDPALALACFEAAVLAGDNPFRRRRAIEASAAAGDIAALSRHRAAYGARWSLPEDLAQLKVEPTQ